MSVTGQRLRPGPGVGWLGMAAIGFYAVHAVSQVAIGRSENLLWACHLADLAVGLGLVLRSRSVTALGLVLLGFGVPMWLVNLAAGGPFYPTSILTHLGGSAVGIVGLRRLGGLQDDWWRAYLFVAGLLVVSRLLTTEPLNVNLVYRASPFLADWLPGAASQVLAAHLSLLLMIWGAGLYLSQRYLAFLLRLWPEAPRSIAKKLAISIDN